MNLARPTNRHRDDLGVALLVDTFDGSGRVERDGRVTFVAANDVDAAAVREAIEAVRGTIPAVERWAAERSVTGRNPQPKLTIGLFAGRDDYERYLLSEGLRGLAGSLGMTHPVRAISVAVVGDRASQANTRIVVAHESVHLWTLRSGICPAWQAWPRWLHEGFALLWDHLATCEGVTPMPPVSETNRPGIRIAPNRDRQRDWRRIAASTDVERFLRADMIKDHRRHGDDYATCWAVTFALATWGHGEWLTELLHHLSVLELQPASGISAEQESLGWLKSRIGTRWAEFARHVASSGKS